jgi:hypothetical protein
MHVHKPGTDIRKSACRYPWFPQSLIAVFALPTTFKRRHWQAPLSQSQAAEDADGDDLPKFNPGVTPAPR